MQGVGAKLSKHVLDMKFMRKTKDQLDKDKVEKTHREHFGVEIKNETEDDVGSALLLTAIAEEVPSYSQCIGYNYGRVSFGGFNPAVEFNVNHGLWKSVHAGATESDNEIEGDETTEKDIPDEEMARTYGSLIGTLGKHFMKKKDRNKDEAQQKGTTKRREEINPKKSKYNRGEKTQTEESGDVAKKRFGWKKDRGWKKSQKKDNSNISTTSGQKNNTRQPESQPPQKKRKFLKPFD